MSMVQPPQQAPWSVVSAARLCLTARYLPLAVAVLSVLLALPSLRAGWMLDDYFHRAVLLERSRYRELLGAPSEMFRFFRGDPERAGQLIDLGLYPWWTYPSLKGEFLQALTVLTHRLDYALWPDSPVLMHAHSLIWLAMVVGFTACFYRRMLGATWVAGVAALVFAVDDARGATVGFIANRNVLVAATFGVPALIAHDRARRDGSRIAAWLAPLLLAGALFSKEEGVGTCAYLAAYSLCVDRKGWWRAALALWPYLLVGVVWASLRAYWGYGVRDVGLYIDPLSDTGRYLAAAVGRIPVLLLGQWTPFPADLGIVMPPALLWVTTGLLLGLILFALGPLLRRDRLARFWAVGMLLALLPVSATLPGDRLLTFASIGAAGLLAQFWAFVIGDRACYAHPHRGLDARKPEDRFALPVHSHSECYVDDAPASRRWRALAQGVAWCLVAVHLVAAPLACLMRAGNPVGPWWIERRLYIPTGLVAAPEGRTVVVVNAPSPMHANYLGLRRELEGKSVPRFMRVLAPAMSGVTIRRLDERTLAIRPHRGYLRWVLDRVFRSERRGFAVGEQVKLTGMTVRIMSLTDDGRPSEAAFRFDERLESPSFVWLCFRRGGFEPFTVPDVGQEVEIPFDVRALVRPPVRYGR